VSSRVAPTELLPWALSQLPPGGVDASPALQLVAGDASNRRYFRLELGSDRYIVAQAPPETEKNEAFLSVRNLLADIGVRVPEVLGVDLSRGYLLLEDLGDQMLLPLLNATTVDRYYCQARAILLQLALPAGAARDLSLDLPAYDEALLREELGRFGTWFVEKLLGHSVSTQEQGLIEALTVKLVASALEQPVVLVHRDFHSRNLMPQPDGQLAVIDFQDAVHGPVTYDLVSLLRDCYIRWPTQRVDRWALEHRDQLLERGLPGQIDDALFLRWFDWMGLQRHIKVLGTFARLHLRDDKPGYLQDLPLVIHYVRQILEKYTDDEPAFAEFGDWFDKALQPLIEQQPWGAPQ
jgi:aminoglycoside/choline kinase family phosphotransferase